MDRAFRPFHLQPPLVVQKLNRLLLLAYRLGQPQGCRTHSAGFRSTSVGLRLFPAGSPRRKAESSSSPMDWSFTSRCSPPPFAGTQFRSVTECDSILTGTLTPLIRSTCKRTGCRFSTCTSTHIEQGLARCDGATLCKRSRRLKTCGHVGHRRPRQDVAGSLAASTSGQRASMSPLKMSPIRMSVISGLASP